MTNFKSFPVKFTPNCEDQNETGGFISDLNYEFNYKNNNYFIFGVVNCLKVSLEKKEFLS